MLFLAFALEGRWRESHVGWSGHFDRSAGQMIAIHGPSMRSHSVLPSQTPSI